MQKSKLRVGLLLDSYFVAAWEFKMLENMINSDYASIELVLINDNQKSPPNKTLLEKIKHNYGSLTSLCIRKLYDILYKKTIERHTYLPNADEETNSATLLANIPVHYVKTVRKQWSDYFLPEDISIVKQHTIDILVRCGFGILRGDILTSARYGIWSYHHADNNVNRGGPPGFWESLQSWTETGSILQILTEDLDNGNVLYRSFSCTDPLSVTDNKNNYYWKSLTFMTRKMQELYRLGEENFFENVQHANKHPFFYSERLYIKPTSAELIKLYLNKLKEKIYAIYINRVYMDQWILMFHLKTEFSSSLWRYKKIIPPKDRFWADPHLYYRNNHYYIFIEEYIYHTQKGHIALIIMDEKGEYQAPEIILETPYHLSYPFVFEHENELYMIPETHSNRTIELYKCVEFPYKWEFQLNLMENVQALDATLHYHNNKWWMFANMIEIDGASSWDELYLFSSPELLSTHWQAHPLNPIISDCKSSRPAGKLFTRDGRLYRPSQNGSKRYGYGFNLAEITRLDDNHYEEVIVNRVNPNWDKSIFGTHTFNRVNALHMIDAIYRRRR